MISLLELQKSAATEPSGPARGAATSPAAETQAPDTHALDTHADTDGDASELTAPAVEEFELVVGRRQIASLLFVFLIILVVSITGAYLVGKSSAPRPVAAAAPAESPPAPLLIRQEAPPVPGSAAAVDPEKPIFTDPKKGEVYIQMGVVDRGVAEIFAEGLRRKGLDGVVGPGPTAKEFRVLIGPLPTPDSFRKAKEVVDKIGLSTFGRRWEY